MGVPDPQGKGRIEDWTPSYNLHLRTYDSPGGSNDQRFRVLRYCVGHLFKDHKVRPHVISLHRSVAILQPVGRTVAVQFHQALTPAYKSAHTSRLVEPSKCAELNSLVISESNAIFHVLHATHLDKNKGGRCQFFFHGRWKVKNYRQRYRY